ncbi:hypothetical protein JX266_001474 [Neoarthrinium moseri]|nr:hypothetical protein JX266_001474 [Neoarthrinium moseri]
MPTATTQARVAVLSPVHALVPVFASPSSAGPHWRVSKIASSRLGAARAMHLCAVVVGREREFILARCATPIRSGVWQRWQVQRLSAAARTGSGPDRLQQPRQLRTAEPIAALRSTTFLRTRLRGALSTDRDLDLDLGHPSPSLLPRELVATMAVSPMVLYPTDALQNANIRAASSPLKNASSAQASSNGTPAATVVPNAAAAVQSTSLDIAEQLNEDEKRKYVKGKKLGEGTYANVYLGHLRNDPSQLVAIKKIKVQKEYTEGMAPDAVREIKHLQELSHPNIITLHTVFSSKDQNLNLVLEYLPLGDLEMLIRDEKGVHYGAADMKAWIGMLTRAVWFCHENFVLHRDIKPNNLLIAADGEVKLADFGLARSFSDPYKPMTSNVITRWYRPPELLYGVKHYSGAVDIWSVGCVIAELVMRAPFMPGNTELEQINLICLRLGTPTEENWPGVTKLKEYTTGDTVTPVPTKTQYQQWGFGALGNEGVDLLMKTLRLDPKKRITAREMLDHEYWSTDPKPTRLKDLPRKAGGEEKLGADLKRPPGMVDEGRGNKVARKLDFGAAN